MENKEYKKEIDFFILIYAISRFFILFIPASTTDIPKVSMSIESALTVNALTYPGLYQLQLALFELLFGVSIVGVRLGLMLYEIGSLVILYKFTYLFQKQEFQKNPKQAASHALIVIYIFAFFPHEIFNFSGFSEIMSTFFVISGLYAYYRGKMVLAAIMFGIGFLVEIYPIFFLVPIVIHLLLKKKITIIAKIIGSLLITVLLGTLPFYILNPGNFLANYLAQFSRVPNAVSFWEEIYNNSVTWTILIIPGLVEISPIGIAFIVWFVCLAVFSFIYFKKRKEASVQEEFLVMIVFLLLLSLVFLSLLSRYVFFAFPLLVIIIDSRVPVQELRYHSTRILIFCIIPISVVTLVLWPSLNFINPLSIHIQILELYGFFLALFYSILSLFWIDFGKRLPLNRKVLKYPTVIQLISLSFMLFFFQAISSLVNGYYLLIEIPILTVGLVPIIWSVKNLSKRFPSTHSSGTLVTKL